MRSRPGWRLPGLDLPAFVDHRHTTGVYPMPEGDAKQVLDALLAASDVVFVSPVYWFSVPSPPSSASISGVPGCVCGSRLQVRMAGKRLWVVATSGDRAKAQPMLDSCRLCAEFMGMEWKGALWGKVGRRIRCSPTRRRWLRLKPTLHPSKARTTLYERRPEIGARVLQRWARFGWSSEWVVNGRSRSGPGE